MKSVASNQLVATAAVGQVQTFKAKNNRMSLFDTYIPNFAQNCSVCGEPLVEWQGKEGPCGLFVWKEGCANPVGQNAGDVSLDPEKLLEKTLPEQFSISCHDCSCKIANTAKCETTDGVWSKTILVTGSNATIEKHETKSEFRQRMKWLRSTS